MPRYQYDAAYSSGEQVSGVVEAVSEQAAVAQIRQTCEVVLRISEIKSPASDPLTRFRRTSPKSLALICQQFSVILKSGLPLVQAVDLVAGQCPDKMLRQLFQQVSDDISNGWSMSYSLNQRGGGKLPVTFVETIRAGEESGDLIDAFQRLSGYYERMSKTRNKAVSAMIYPAFVLTAAVIVVFVIMTVAVPAFTATFESMGIELPMITRALIALSGFMSKYALGLVAIIVAIILALRLYGNTQSGGIKLSALRLKLPVIGRIGLMAGASQFAHTMSTMMAAGMPVLQALDISGRAISNHRFAQSILNIIPGVEAGHGMGACMKGDPVLPEMLVQMTAIGEATGSLESTLDIMAEYYDNEVDTATARAMSLLEPMIIVFLGVTVAFVLLSVYLPLFTMEQGI